MKEQVMNQWIDCGDAKSYLHDADGKVLAEILCGASYLVWSVSIRSRPRGLWAGRDAAKAACERIVAEEKRELELEIEWPWPLRRWMSRR